MYMTKQRRLYRTSDDRVPYEEWLDGLRDVMGRAKIRIRVDCAALGNFGKHRMLGAGLIELKIDYGPGYRVYMGLQGPKVLVLLLGGDKSTQEKDITRAHQYWKDYKRRL